MSRYLRYTLLTLLWVAVAAYIVFAASAVRRVRRTGTVGKLEIEVELIDVTPYVEPAPADSTATAEKPEAAPAK